MKAAGFSLVEVLVATSVVAVAVASLAQLFIVSARAGRIAHTTSTTMLLAQQKMEELQADLPGSIPSPSGALFANTPGYFEYIDRFGVSVGGASFTPPADAIYVRRWAVEPLEGLEGLEEVSGSAGDAIVLKVLVRHLTNGVTPPSSVSTGQARAPGEARLVSVKTRRAG